MKAAALLEHGNAFERSRHQLAFVPHDTRLGKPRDVGVRDAHGVLHFLAEESQARSQHDRHAGPALSEPASHRVGGGADLCFTRGGRLGHNSMPASVAERKLASVPAIIARKPSLARSCLRLGASAPMPPIWMPTELRFAKPHSANVAMVNDTGSSVALSVPSCA